MAAGESVSCERCHDIGIICSPPSSSSPDGGLELCSCIVEQCQCGGQRPFQIWDKNGRIHDCPCRRVQFRLNSTKHAFRDAGVPRKYRWKTRTGYLMRAPDGSPIPRAAKIIAHVARLATDEAEPERGLLLHGPPGTGKTLLACIVLNELMLFRGRPGRYLNLSRDYYQALRDTFSESSEQHGQASSLQEELCMARYLVIDDFGIERGTEWEEEVLYELVDARYNQERFTVVTTNLSKDEIKGISRGRIFSRLVEMCHWIEMKSPDWREAQFGTASMR